MMLKFWFRISMAFTLFFLPLASAQALSIAPVPSGDITCKKVYMDGKCGPDGKCTGNRANDPASYKGEDDRPECDYTFCDLIGVLINVADIIFKTVGALALVYFLYGSLLMVISAGSERLNQGKTAMKNAVVGLAIVLLSYEVVGIVVISTVGGAKFEGGVIKIATGWASIAKADCRAK